MKRVRRRNLLGRSVDRRTRRRLAGSFTIARMPPELLRLFDWFNPIVTMLVVTARYKVVSEEGSRARAKAYRNPSVTWIKDFYCRWYGYLSYIETSASFD